MTINYVDKGLCTGCGLCQEECPYKSISMKPDNEGFLRPVIDNTTCMDCALCYKKCPINVCQIIEDTPIYYAASIKNKDMLMKSSSGGLFYILAKRVLSQGGSVCGCVIGENKHVTHICTKELSDVKRMMGSKYTQSVITSCLPQIKDKLSVGEVVLFTGTACQVAAVRQYMQDHQNLITVDVLCHGVPSPLYFKKYLEYLEHRYKGNLKTIEFRNKQKNGWGAEHRTYIEIEKDGKIKKIRPTLPSYFCAFYYGLNLRPSCYKCKYAGTNRISDITIGDFWGATSLYEKENFSNGISIASVNTTKGKLLFDNIMNDCTFCDVVDQKHAMGTNTNFYHPTQNYPERATFYEYINEEDAYRKTIKKVFLAKSTRRKLLVSLYGKFVPEFAKKLYKKLNDY